MRAVCLEQENMLPTSSKDFEVRAEMGCTVSPGSLSPRRQRYLSTYSHKKELVKPSAAIPFISLVSTDEFDQLPLEALCALLSSNDINAPDELEIFMAAVKWLMFDFVNRQENVVGVMKCIRFGLMSPWVLINIRRNPQNPEFVAVATIPEVRKMIQEGCNYALYRSEFGGDEAKSFWVDQLNLTVPESRHYSGVERKNISFHEFLSQLESVRLKDELHLNQQCCPAGSAMGDVNCCGDSPRNDSKSCQCDTPVIVDRSSQCENPSNVHRSAQCDVPTIESKGSQCDGSSFDRKIFCCDAPVTEDVY